MNQFLNFIFSLIFYILSTKINFILYKNKVQNKIKYISIKMYFIVQFLIQQAFPLFFYKVHYFLVIRNFSYYLIHMLINIMRNSAVRLIVFITVYQIVILYRFMCSLSTITSFSKTPPLDTMTFSLAWFSNSDV